MGGFEVMNNGLMLNYERYVLAPLGSDSLNMETKNTALLKPLETEKFN